MEKRVKTTQYTRIINYAKAHKIFTLRDLMIHCNCNWPHSRLRELEARGCKFDRWWQGDPKHIVVHLVRAPK